MSTLGTDINNLKKKYREIFLKTSDEIIAQIEKLKPVCTNCTPDCNLEIDLFTAFPKNCVFTKWQKDVLNLFDNEISKEIYKKWTKILEYRNQFHCAGCGCCCKLACSEFSPEELQTKAKNNDNFARQFTSIFIPYNNKEEARKIYPEYFDLLEEKGVNVSSDCNSSSSIVGEGEEVHFYHCPKLNADDRCSDYENRPDICRDFPNNPLSLLPKSCGYSGWKDEVEPVALMLHSMLEIIDFYKQKLKG